MFKIEKYEFTKKLSTKDKKTLKQIYDDGVDEGYDDGYNDGYEEGESSAVIQSLEIQKEGKEEGYETAVSEFVDKVGYLNLVQLQERTQCQICYGDNINFNELISAIKTLLENERA